MPAQIIDPRLNQIERKRGILCDLDGTFFAFYSKKDITDPLRFVGEGTILDVTKYNTLPRPELWHGVEITREAVVTGVNNDLTGPVYKMLNKRIREMFTDPKGDPKKTLKDIKDEIKNNRKRFDDSDITNADTFESEFYPQ
jgi:hypothetical protein